MDVSQGSATDIGPSRPLAEAPAGGGTVKDVRRRSAMRLAERFQPGQSHPRQVARLALQLFDASADLHRLDSDARELLEYAALLHDIGRAISHSRHHFHSGYLIANGDLGGFRRQEIEIIACIARLHRGSAPRLSRLPLAALPSPYPRLVITLATLLRLADGLDRGRRSAVTEVELIRTRGGLEAAVTVRDTDVLPEWWASRRNARMWERCFGQPLVVRFVGVRIETSRKSTTAIASAAPGWSSPAPSISC